MTVLIDQKTAAPTRKLWAVAIVTGIVQGLLFAADVWLPGIRAAIPGEQIVAVLVPLLAGYMTRERA